jgi:PKD repeat protein
MTNCLRFLCLSALFFFFSFSSQLGAQIFTGEKLDYQSPILESAFSAFEVFRIDAEPLAAYVRTNAEANTTLQVGNHVWNMSLSSSNLLSQNYFLTIETPSGNTVSHKKRNIAYKGFLSTGDNVRLTLDKGFMYGYIRESGLVWRIEPLWYLDPTADKDLYVLYEKSNVLADQTVPCGVTAEMEKAAQMDIESHLAEGADFPAVYELELAIASDQLMLAKYGSSSAVEAHNIAVINDVEGDYTGAFTHDLCINIVTQFVATTFPGPWSASNDAGTLLGSFLSWGNAGNFGVNFDVGELWTNRDFTGGTVGIAYLNGVCNNNKYHALQDFTGNSELLRCTTSHELGHNFSSGHDSGCSGSGPWIMCPTVSTSNSWSSQSQNAISAYMQTKINSGCLASCVQGPPLVSIFDWSPDPGCVNQPVQFTDMSTGTITSRLWTFTGGTPATSTQTNPVVTFGTSGNKNVSLVVFGPGGTSATSTQVVTINPTPVSGFTFTMDDLTATFTNTSTNATSYLWDFGDGGTSTEDNPVYTYIEAGFYVVKLTATNDCGSSTKTITVNTFPTPDFYAEPTSGCATLVVQLVNQSSSNSTSFLWSFPGGTPASSGQANPVVLYTISGTYPITLTAFNSVGSNTITKTNYITVQTVPATNFTSSVNGLTATFTNTTLNGTTYLWTFGDGDSSTVVHPVHTYANGGTYTVTLIATNACGSVTKTKTVEVAPPPVAGFTTTGNNGCAPATISFTNTSTGAVSYNWAFPGGSPASSTDTNVTVVYTNPGTYTVTLTATNNSGTSTATTTVTVNTVPAPSFSSVTNGAVVTFTNTTNNATSYSWNFADGNSSTEQNPTHTYAADGVYTVVLTATNICGTATSTQTVTVVTPPVAGFTASPTGGCAPLTVSFNNTSSSNSTSFQWTFPGGNPGSSIAPNPTVVYNTPGIYSVTLVATNSAGSSTLTQANFITVNTVPTAGFTSVSNGAMVAFTNTSNNASSYSWNFGDGNSSTQTNPNHTYATDGVYTVVLSATNACGTVTSSSTVTIVTPPTAGFNATQTSGCAPFTVQFNNTSSSNSVNFDWQFPGGNPASSTAQNPTVVYNTPGVYTVILTASNSAGSNTATQVNYITVGTTPVAGFTSVTNADVATFTNTTQNGVSYSWNFGDGESSTEANPSHVYANDGTYTVVLTATNACGTSTFTQNVVIVTGVEASFTADITSGCAPLTVNFLDMSSDNTTGWQWSFPGGTPNSSTQQNPTVVYNTPGVYSVTLVVSGPGGTATFTRTDYITVLGPPTGSFTSVVNQNTATFTNNTVNGTTYLWTFGDGGSSTLANPSHTYAQDGTYTVILAATNNCGTTIIENSVTILTPPVAAFTFNSAMGCTPLTVLFNNTSSSNSTSFSWVFEGGTPPTSTEQNPVCTWNTPGVYLVTLTASNSAGNSTATATITVNPNPTASFTTQTAGLSVITTNASQHATSYSWTFGDGGTSTEMSPTHTYMATGTYTITLVATNECGSSTTTQTVVIEGTAPIVSFSADQTSGCPGFSVQFTDASAGNPTSWMWTFEGGTPANSLEQNPSVTYTTPGTYSVTLVASNLFGSGTSTQTSYITVVALPTADFSAAISGGIVTFTNNSQGGTAYSWDFGDGQTSNEKNPVNTYNAPGTYNVSMTVTNSCGAATLQQTVVILSVGTGEVAWLNEFRLFPNPNSGLFRIEMSGIPSQNLEFAVFNKLGQVLSMEIVDFSAGILSKAFDFSSMPSGVYTLRLQTDAAAKYVKIVVQK